MFDDFIGFLIMEEIESEENSEKLNEELSGMGDGIYGAEDQLYDGGDDFFEIDSQIDFL